MIDASGDGQISALAGAEYDIGTEAKREYNERSAPEMRKKLVQGTSLVAIAYRAEREIPFIPPKNIPEYVPRVFQGKLASFIYHHTGMFKGEQNLMFLYMTETGGERDTILDDAEIYEDLLNQLWAEWNHIKNGEHKELAKNWDLLWVSPKAGKRESRRFFGDYVLTQTDIEAGRCFEDDIAYGGHDLDDHKPINGTANIFAYSLPPLYGIPYRCCYSKNLENLMLAGRLISATHIAHSSVRVMRTGGAIGQAVGLAASICKEYGCKPRDIYKDKTKLNLLQNKILENDGTILGRKCEGENDLARLAQVTASSELIFNNQQVVKSVPLISQAGNLFWDWPEMLESLEIHMENSSNDLQLMTLKIFRAKRERKWKTYDEYNAFGRNDLRDVTFEMIYKYEFDLEGNFKGWRKLEFPSQVLIGKKDMLSDDDRVIISLDANSNVKLGIVEGDFQVAKMIEHSAHSEQWYIPLGVMAAMRSIPVIKLGEAENIKNGYHRRFSRGPLNMWISNPEDGLPAEIMLSWGDNVRFNTVELTFDNLTSRREDAAWESGKRVVDFLVKSYVLEAFVEGNWVCLVREDNNYHRFRRHRVGNVLSDKLRLRVLETYGGSDKGCSARVYQIRVLDV